MIIQKAVITAAGRDQKNLPLQNIVSATGQTKTAIELILDEVLEAGICKVALVIAPGQTEAFRSAVGKHLEQVTLIEQEQPLGYGHAVLCAADFTKDEPFLLLVGDHLYLSDHQTSCVKQLLDAASAEECSVSAVQATREGKLAYYGAIGGKRIPGSNHLYTIDQILENQPLPSPSKN